MAVKAFKRSKNVARRFRIKHHKEAQHAHSDSTDTNLGGSFKGSKRTSQSASTPAPSTPADDSSTTSTPSGDGD